MASETHCEKCGKVVTRTAEAADRFRVCFCGAAGGRLFHRLFPEYANMAPRPRRSRTRRPRAAW